MPRGGNPGDLYVVEPSLDESANELETAPSLWDAHTMNPEKVLHLAASFDEKTARAVVVGCESAHLNEDNDIRGDLSHPVQAAIDDAIRLVESLVTEYLAERRLEYVIA